MPNAEWTTYIKDYVPPPPTGECVAYSAVRKVQPVALPCSTFSGGPAVSPEQVLHWLCGITVATENQCASECAL